MSIAQLKAHLSEVLGEVQHAQTRVVIEKHGKAVAMLVPVATSRPRGILGLVGAFEDGAQFADAIDAVVKARRTDRKRKVPTLR